MNQSTANKFAAILKAAQEKAAAKTAPKAIKAPTPSKPEEVKPTPPAAKFPVNKDPNNVRTFDNIKDITDASQNGEVISILNLYNIVNDKPQPEAIQDTPELSDFTFEDICNEPAQEAHTAPTTAATLQPCTFVNVLCFKGRDKVEDADKPQATTAPEVIAATTPDKLTGFKTLKIGKFTFVEYSEKSFALLGDTKEDTKAIKDQLYTIGGKFNYYLKCGEGFIFSNRKYYTVKTFISSL